MELELPTTATFWDHAVQVTDYESHRRRDMVYIESDMDAGWVFIDEVDDLELELEEDDD